MIANRIILRYLTLLLGLLLTKVAQVKAQTRISAFFTKEEVEIWKQRAKSGPYKSFGDAQANSPGDWDRIMANANKFVSNPSAERWKGVPTSTCIQVSVNYAPATNGKLLRDAAFLYLLTGNTNFKEAVRKELLAQIGEPNADFSVKKRWCDGILHDLPPSYEINDWLTRLLFAYAYIESGLSSEDKSRIDKWFYNAALYFQRNVDADLSKMYMNRNGGDWTPSNYAVSVNGSLGRTTHYNGYKTSSLSRYYNNRRSSQVYFFTLWGIKNNVSSLKESGKRYVKEALMFGTYPDGTFSEFQRWREDFADIGISYSFLTISQLVNIADYFARSGDFELYKFTTSKGAFGTQGGSKNLQLLVKTMLRHMDGNLKRYGTASASKMGSKAALIDGVNTESGRSWYTVNDTWFAQGNLYFKDSYIKDSYLRRAPGTRAYPTPGSAASAGKHKPYGGAWDVFPGVMLMYGQMEGKVWPYPRTSSTSEDAPIATTAESVTEGSLTEEFWKDIEGENVAMIPLDKTPASISEITSFETSSNTDNHFGRRIRGYVHPPVNGEYTFWIAGDDHCELWLSDDENPETKKQIASVEGWTAEREWDKFSSQKSVTIALQAGKKYYVEVLHKENEGDDHLSVGWQLPDGTVERPISGSRLTPFVIENKARENARTTAVKMPAEAAFTVKAYPNPFQDQVTVKTAHISAGEVFISISDMLGKIWYQHTATVMAGESEITMELSRENLPSGIYLLQTVSPDKQKRLVKIIKP
ncbi:T9SS type A sorting domain-containing protein [Rhodocytophaga rosea]|uniref:T9SS type A sorting domain-containing protein n=1 Tax=Rhodocytophaga rosea TaxID=2704465 RepID=A0A6C0GH49_9BACT|nr:PA14 domain-containing protein [Rhodocytophaga rosea]QHT67259.1 T9SS type A sorting domain-containing protein [Rhodocytophaga rosea]